MSFRPSGAGRGFYTIPLPTAYAMGYDLSPLTGLRDGRAQETHFTNELLTQGARISVRMVFSVQFERHCP